MELLVFLLIIGIAVFIAILIDKNIDKIDIPHIPPECLESDEDSYTVTPGTPAWFAGGPLFNDDFNPSKPGTTAWLVNDD